MSAYVALPQERELLKGALLTSAMAEALRRRGVTDPAASLAAEVGFVAFKMAYTHWVSIPDEQDMSQLIRESLNQIRVMIAGQRVYGSFPAAQAAEVKDKAE